MALIVFCTIVLSFYVIIWFFDSFFKSCMVYPYYAFLNGTGLKIGVLNLSWTTSAFNRPIYRWSKNLRRVLKKWFTCGYYITIWIFFPFVLWTLASVIINHFYVDVQLSGAPEIKVMLPGINIPISDFWLYFLALSLSTIIHELGHAMAAVQDDVQLLAVGMYIFAVVPMAFVHLNSDHLNSLTKIKKLQIYCAGVWHNIASGLLALLVYFSAPILFSIAYETNIGVRVTGFSNDSPLKDVRGLIHGDVVTSINRCEVTDMHDWLFCLQMAHERYGICVSAEFVAQNDEILMETVKENNVVECCRKDDLFSFCFEYMEPNLIEDSVLPGQYSCLQPRDMVKNSFLKCTEREGYACPRGQHCLKPSLNNHTYLLIIERKDDNAVIYLGMPYDLYKTVSVDHYFPRNVFFSYFSPTEVEKFLRYFFVFSMGLAFLNVIPCYGTDGHHIARTLIQILAKYFNKSDDFVTFFTVFILVIGTGVTIPSLMYLFYKGIVYND